MANPLDILEEQITERYVADAREIPPDLVKRRMKCRLVCVVSAILIQRNLEQRKSQPLHLRIQHRAPDSMDADAVIATRHAGEKTDDLHGRIPGQRVQCQRAVLSATPAENDRLGHDAVGRVERGAQAVDRLLERLAQRRAQGERRVHAAIREAADAAVIADVESRLAGHGRLQPRWRFGSPAGAFRPR